MVYAAGLFHGVLKDNKVRLILTALPKSAANVKIKIIEVDRWVEIVDPEEDEEEPKKKKKKKKKPLPFKLEFEPNPDVKFEIKQEGNGTDDLLTTVYGKIVNGKFVYEKFVNTYPKDDDSHELYLAIRKNCVNVPDEIEIDLPNEQYGTEGEEFDKLGAQLEIIAVIEAGGEEVFASLSPTFVKNSEEVAEDALSAHRPGMPPPYWAGSYEKAHRQSD